MLIANLGYALCIFSLYCLAGGFAASPFGARQEVMLPVFFASVAASVIGAAMHKLPRGARLIAVLPVLACAFICRSLPEYLLLALPVIIIVVMQLSDKYVQDYYDFKSLYFKLMAPVIVFMLLCYAFRYMGDLGAYFTVIYIIAGILTLRLLRQDAEVYSTTRFMLANSLPMLAFVVFILILGSGSALSKALSGVGWIFKMIGRGILLIFGGIGWLVLKLQKVDPIQLQDESAEKVENQGELRLRELLNFLERGADKDMTPLLITLGVILFLIITGVVVLIILRHSKRVRGSVPGGGLEKTVRYRGAYGVSAGSSAQTHTPKSSAGIRSLYKKWLKLLKKRRVPITPHDTTLEILEDRAPKAVPYEAHKSLRELYVKARYCEGYAATREEQHAAKAAYEALAAADFNMQDDRYWKE